MNSMDYPSHHRTSILPYGGRVNVPQRFAIDWIKLGAQGRPFHGDHRAHQNYYGYGAEVLAVADATVSAVRDDLPDSPTAFAEKKSDPLAMADAAGNYVILNIGKGRFVVYGHLQPGSVKVRQGERVRQGAMLGRLGNSGTSQLPHLHLHIVDANSPLLADGVPYLFASYVVQGKAVSFDSLMEGKGITKQPGGKPDQRNRELPLNFYVVSFP